MLELFKKSYLFNTLTESELLRIAEFSVETAFKTGDVIIQAYKNNDSIWLIKSGTAAVRDKLPNGVSVSLSELHAGDLFGEISFADSLPASATVIASGDLVAYRFAFRSLKSYFNEQPQAEIKVLRRMIGTLSQRLRRANGAIKKGMESSMGWFVDSDELPDELRNELRNELTDESTDKSPKD